MWCTWCQQGGSTTSSASLPMWLSSRPWPRPLAPPLSLCCLLRPPAPPLPPLASAFRLLLTRVRLLAFFLSPCWHWSFQACPGLLSVQPSLVVFPCQHLQYLSATLSCPWTSSILWVSLYFFCCCCCFLPSSQYSFLLQCHHPW